MKAWRLHGAGDLRLEELPPAQPKEKFVKVKLSYSSLSLTDSMLYTGELSYTPPLTLGRHGVGMVTEVGEGVTNVVRGDRVVIDPYILCESCVRCSSGHATDCADPKTYGIHSDGFFSDFALVRSEDVFKLPDRVKDTDAVFAGHVAFAMNIMTKFNLQKGDHLVIMGAGVIGIILAQIAMYYQVVPIMVDARSDRLKIAESLGVYYCVNSVEEDVYKKIFGLTGGCMAQAVAHIAFNDCPLSRSLEFAQANGKVAIVSWSWTKPDLNASFYPVFNRQLSVFGVSNGAKLIPSAINMLANRAVSVESLITKEVAFSSVEEVLKDQIEHPHKFIKVLIKI